MYPRLNVPVPRRALARVFARGALSVAIAMPVAGMAAELSLAEATRLAVERAPVLDARRADVAAATAEAGRAGALPDPMLTLGVDNLPVTGSAAFDLRADEMTMKKIGLRQDIPARATREARRALADRAVDEAESRRHAETLAVRRSAAEAWILLWAAQRELEALRVLRDEADLAAGAGKARVRGGEGGVGGALALQAALVEVDGRVEAARAAVDAAGAELARWLGGTGDTAESDMPDFTRLPVTQAELLAALDRLGPVVEAGAKLETAAAAVHLARAGKRPDWSLAASYGQRDEGRADMLMVEVGIGLPLFARHRQDRGVTAREAEYQAALATREEIRRESAARIRAGFARWEGLKRQVALHADALLPLSRDRTATALAAFRAGGELAPWLEARREELEIQVSHAGLIADLGRAWAALAFLLPSENQP
jgi:outer membrane protein TolC